MRGGLEKLTQAVASFPGSYLKNVSRGTYFNFPLQFTYNRPQINSSMSKSTLIFGASGVTGWSFINELLHDYPKPGVWNKVYALTNRPLSQSQSQWPNDPRLNIVSGIDLLKGSQEDLEAEIKEKIKGIGEVTHMYYLAYRADTDLQKELEDAVAMFQRATIAVDKLAPGLEFVVLQTGAKMCMPSSLPFLPLSESGLTRHVKMAAICSKTTPLTTYTSPTRSHSPGSRLLTTTCSSIIHNSTGCLPSQPQKAGTGLTHAPTSLSDSSQTRTSTPSALFWAYTSLYLERLKGRVRNAHSPARKRVGRP